MNYESTQVATNILRKEIDRSWVNGRVAEELTISVGASKAIYIKSLKKCRLTFAAYMHSIIEEINKFSNIQAYSLKLPSGSGIDINATAIDLMTERLISNELDDVTATQQLKKPYSNAFEDGAIDIIEASLGDFLSSDLPSTAGYIHLPTSIIPVLGREDTFIAPSQSPGTNLAFLRGDLNPGDEILIVFKNEDSQTANESAADIHLVLDYGVR